MAYPSKLTAQQTAQLIILRLYYLWQDSPWKDAEFTAEEIAQHWADNLDDLQDARNEAKYQGAVVPYDQVRNRIHHTWERNYEVDVRVINLEDGRGLALNNVTGGGKHGEPTAYPWFDECWFVKHTGTTTVVKHTYEDIPEVKDEPTS